VAVDDPLRLSLAAAAAAATIRSHVHGACGLLDNQRQVLVLTAMPSRMSGHDVAHPVAAKCPKGLEARHRALERSQLYIRLCKIANFPLHIWLALPDAESAVVYRQT
jgi:hypothetical protein